ncbi:hypothetical protein [Halococcus sediminicola]|nr:hypothetical protein [Halococcus sediminicola]
MTRRPIDRATAGGFERTTGIDTVRAGERTRTNPSASTGVRR